MISYAHININIKHLFHESFDLDAYQGPIHSSIQKLNTVFKQKIHIQRDWVQESGEWLFSRHRGKTEPNRKGLYIFCNLKRRSVIKQTGSKTPMKYIPYCISGLQFSFTPNGSASFGSLNKVHSFISTNTPKEISCSHYQYSTLACLCYFASCFHCPLVIILHVRVLGEQVFLSWSWMGQ